MKYFIVADSDEQFNEFGMKNKLNPNDIFFCEDENRAYLDMMRNRAEGCACQVINITGLSATPSFVKFLIEGYVLQNKTGMVEGCKEVDKKLRGMFNSPYFYHPIAKDRGVTITVMPFDCITPTGYLLDNMKRGA
jgi:hypothetical protein